MSLELLLVCLVVGACTYLFRYLPTRLKRGDRPRGAFGGALGAFLGSVGIAAVTALLVAALDGLRGPPALTLQLQGPVAPVVFNALTALVGVAVTLLSFRLRRDVALSTLLGAAAYGVAWWLVT